ncbi:GSU2403 family nucleotidyltransferase fold protein [Qipengyuania sp. XHP0211]|uniref:GSU2403 family nucleotidyltransferase fold protein n=1 Tax=Qipengyuania sp. XHP0211 TaxID=3038079 RepID=UPI002420115F|nr:GSU2403 family nucleotidyltransferase fold protein [Qipengyuania sp. XHP0211]MDG5751972.1 GSU2403 family nucleotidyltransferase fold protein [Qipengyuania sp. XHP0211]
MPVIRPFSPEQERALINLRQRYEVWIEAERDLASLPYDLRRKKVGEYEYLYEIHDRSGNGTSLGAWDDEKQQQFEEYRERKQSAKQRREGAGEALSESSRIARALRLPLLSADAGPILREADRRGLLGSHLLVVGTNAMAAYAIEAAGSFNDVPDETEDFDLAWAAEEEANEAVVWEMLKAVDPTFTINTERDFQARNAKAYEVELLVAPSRAETLGAKDRPKPVPLPEQEWLLPGRRVDQVVPCRDGTPARIVAPDPRWFALHKLWLGSQAKRNSLKRRKDVAQGKALLDAVSEAMPQYNLDEAFAAELPADLVPFFDEWRNRSNTHGN